MRQSGRQGSVYTDRHGPRVFGLVLFVIGLSIIDAVLTLYLIGHGAAEINPVMASFLEHGISAFFIAKYTLTGASLILLVIYRNVRLFNGRLRAVALFWFVVAAFLLVISWEIYLLAQIETAM